MNSGSSSSDQLKLDENQVCGSKLCPSCGHKLEGKPVSIIIIILTYSFFYIYIYKYVCMYILNPRNKIFFQLIFSKQLLADSST